MFLACALLIIATLSGVLLTFLFDRAAPLSARLCLGAPIGLTILAWTGFIFSLVFGMSAASIALASVVVGTQLFLTGFIAELLSRNSPGRNSYLIEEKLGLDNA